MERARYDIELRGFNAAPGTIDAVALRDLLDALIGASEKALRLALEGSSTRRGPKPTWLTDSVRFLITDLREGSTIVPVQVPFLRDAAEDVVKQRDFWHATPDPKATALTVLSEVIEDVAHNDRESLRYDKGVLKALGTFGRIITNGESITIRDIETPGSTFEITRRHIQQAEALAHDTPDPFSVILSGTLDVIEHSQRAFRLLTAEGKTVRGSVESGAITEQDMRELWGESVTLQGNAHFTPGGTLRFIETRTIGPARSSDTFFEQSKKHIEEKAASRQRPLAEQDPAQFDAGTDVQNSRGAWPGDESIDEILDAID